MRNDISTYTIDRQIEAMYGGNFKLSEIVDKNYENKVQQLLDMVVKERQKFENLSDLDKLTNVMVEKGIPRSAQVVDVSGNPMPQFDEKAATRRNTKKAAKKTLELVDGDYDKALEIVKTMT